MGTDDMIEKNIAYIKANKEVLLERYSNKYLLVCNEKLEGSYDTYEAALSRGIEAFGLDAGFVVYHLIENEPVNFLAIA